MAQVLGMARPAAVATKVKGLVPVLPAWLSSKVVQCQWCVGVPKRGFNNRWALKVAVVNVGQLEEAFQDGEEVNREALAAKNLAKGNYDLLKVLGDGEISKKLQVSAHKFSKSAQEKIEKAGGSVVVVPGKTPVAEKQQAKKAKK